MATPPNPFDPQAVNDYLNDKAATEARRTKAIERLAEAEPADAPEHVEDTPAAEARAMLDYWAERGPLEFAEALTALAASLEASASELEAADAAGLNIDVVLIAARLGRSLEAAGKLTYNAARGKLWELAGETNGAVTTPAGETFAFRPGAKTTTRVDRQRLKDDYPEVYAEVVTITERPDNTPGSLYV